MTIDEALFPRTIRTMKVSIRELKANPARAIAMIRPGQPVQITSHRKVVAQLVPPDPAPTSLPQLSDEEVMQRLTKAGYFAQLASQALQLPTPVSFEPSEDEQTMSDLVLALRGPR